MALSLSRSWTRVTGEACSGLPDTQHMHPLSIQHARPTLYMAYLVRWNTLWLLVCQSGDAQILELIHIHSTVRRRADATAAGKAPQVPQATGSGDIVVDLTISDEESEHEASAPALRKGASSGFFAVSSHP